MHLLITHLSVRREITGYEENRQMGIEKVKTGSLNKRGHNRKKMLSDNTAEEKRKKMED